MHADGGQRGGALAGEQAAKDFDMTEVAGRTSPADGFGRREKVAHRREVARELEGACSADMGEGKARVSIDGAVEGRDGAGVHGQEEVDTFDVGISRGRGAGGDGETETVCQHGDLPAEWDRWVMDGWTVA